MGMSPALLIPWQTGISRFSQISGLIDFSVDYTRVTSSGSRTLTASDKTSFVGTALNTTRIANVSFWFEAWIKPTVVNITQYIYHDGGDTNANAGIAVLLANTTLRLQISDGTTTANYDSTATIVAGVWTHILIAANRTAPGSATIYVNGVAAGVVDISARDADDISTDATLFPTVAGLQAASNWFGGSLAHIRYGEGYLPTTADIAWLAASPRTYADIDARGGNLITSLTSTASITGFNYECNETNPTSNLIDQAGTLDLVRTPTQLLTNPGFETRAGWTGVDLKATDKVGLKATANIAPGTNCFSFAVSIKPDTIAAGYRCIFTSTINTEGFMFYQLADKLKLYIGDGLVNLVVTFDTTLAADTAYHLVVTCDRAGLAKLYVNGVIDSTTLDISSATDSMTGSDTYVGQSAVGEYFSGRIGQVQYWEHATAVLDQTLVTSLYNSGLGRYYPEMTAAEKVNLVGAWDLCNGPYSATSQALDSVGTNHLTFTPGEMVTNGAMAADTGWTGTAGTAGLTDYDATATIAGGVMTMACDGTGPPTICSVGQALALLTGRSYTFAGAFTRTSGLINLCVRASIDPASAGEVVEAFAATNATYSEVYTMTATRAFLLLQTTNDAAASWVMDNLSIKAASLPCVSDADLFAGWVESGPAGKWNVDTSINAYSGLSARGYGAYDVAALQGVQTIGNLYQSKVIAKAGTGTPSIYAGGVAQAITTTYAEYVNTYTATAANAQFSPWGSAVDNPIYLDNCQILSAGVAVGNGPAEAIAEDSVGTNDGTLTGFSAAQLITCRTTEIATALGDGGLALTFDGTDDYLSCGNVGNVTNLDFYVKFLADNQEICTLAGSTATAITVAAGTLTFGAGLTMSAVTIDGTVYTADLAAAGALLNDNAWHHVVITITSVAASDFRIGTDFTAYGNIVVDEFKLGAAHTWSMNDYFGAPADGDPVTSMTAREGSRQQAIQTTAAYRPTYASAVTLLNGQPALRFTAANTQYLRVASSLLTGTSGYIALIVAIPAAGDVTTKQTLICSADESTANYYLDVYIEGGVWKVAQKNNDAEVITVTSTTACAANAAYLVEIESNGTTVTVHINRILQTVSDGTQDWFGDTSARDNFTIGAKVTSAVSGAFNHWIAAVLALDRAPTAGEKATIRNLSRRIYGTP